MTERPTGLSTTRTSNDVAYPSQTLMEQEHIDDADNLPLLSQPPSTYSLQRGQHAREASAVPTSPVHTNTSRPGSQDWHPQQYQYTSETSKRQAAPAASTQATLSAPPPHLTIPSPLPPPKPAQSSPPKSSQQSQPSQPQVPQFDAAARLELYRVLIGILPAPRVPSDPLSLEGPHIHHRFLNPFRRTPPSRKAPGSNDDALPLRAATNLGVYHRILQAETNAHIANRFYATCINIAYLLGIALSATITAISAYSSSSKSPTSISITVMGAVNAAATALVAYLKARGLPTRKLLYKNQLRRVREYAEWRERQFAIDAKLGIVGAATVEGAVNAQDLASLAISTPNITQGAAAGNDTYTPGGATSASAGGGGSWTCKCHCGCAKCHCPGNKPATSSSSSVKSSKSSSNKKDGGGSAPPPPSDPNPLTPYLTAGGAILLDPRREAEIVEQMYWAARQDEEANYPETYSYGGRSVFGGSASAGGSAVAQTSSGGRGSASGPTTRNTLLADIAAKAGGIVTDAIPLAVLDWSHHQERQRLQYQQIAAQTQPQQLQLAEAHFHYHPPRGTQNAPPTESAQDYKGQYRDGYSHGYGASRADPPLQPQSEKQSIQIQNTSGPAPTSAPQPMQPQYHQQQSQTQRPSNVYDYGYDGSQYPPSARFQTLNETQRAQDYRPTETAVSQAQLPAQSTQHPTQPPRPHHNNQRIQSVNPPSTTTPGQQSQEPQTHYTTRPPQQHQGRTITSPSTTSTHSRSPSHSHNSWNAMAAWTDTGLSGAGLSTDLGGGRAEGAVRYMPLAPARTVSGAHGGARGRGAGGGRGAVVYEYV